MTPDFSNFLIMTDLDGTFLNSEAKPVERNIKAIERFKQHGGLFSFASGRVIHIMRKVYPGFDGIINSPALLCNGSCIYDNATGNYLNEIFLDGEIVRQVARDIKEMYPYFVLTIYEGDYTMYHDRPIDEIPTNKWNKMCMLGDEADILKAREFIIEKYGNIFNYVRSSARFLEIINKDVSKGKMLGFLKEHYRKQGRELIICAAGDYENDLEMLKAADISVCPSNAFETVKEICDHVVCSNNDGVIADLIDIIEKSL